MVAQLGFTCEVSHRSAVSPAARQTKPTPAPVPQSAPPFFVAAFERARAAGRPVVLDFWARWCVPCVRLKNETLEDPAVSAALAKVELVMIDLDKYPQLGEAYGVAAVPDVVFVDRDGLIVDRVGTFEPPARFLARLQVLLGE
jgi:thiol:disulfide interchange protein DsbD